MNTFLLGSIFIQPLVLLKLSLFLYNLELITAPSLFFL